MTEEPENIMPEGLTLDAIPGMKNVTFWRNWWEGALSLPDSERLKWYDAIMDFAFNGVEPTMADGIKYLAVSMTKAAITKSAIRASAGSKGGASLSKREANGSKREAKRKQTQANAKQTEANTKQTEANAKQTEANAKQNASKRKQNAETVKQSELLINKNKVEVEVEVEKEVEVEVCETRTRSQEVLSLKQLTDYAASHFAAPKPTPEFLADFHRRMCESGWYDKVGRAMSAGMVYRELSAWWQRERIGGNASNQGANNSARASTAPALEDYPLPN